MQQERNHSTVSQLLTQLQNRVISLSGAREFHDPETASSSGVSHVPSQTLFIPCPRGMFSRDSGLPLDTRNLLDTSGKPTWSRRTILSSLRKFKMFGIIFLRVDIRTYHGTWKRGETRSAEFFNTNPRFERVQGPLYHIGGTYSQHSVVGFPRYPISEMHLGKFLGLLDFESWKVNFKTECAVLPQITMHWIKAVEIAKSIDDLLTQSITGRRDFHDYHMVDSKIASALKKIITSVHFRRRVSFEEQRAQKYDRFLRGRQIAYMIYEYFRATGACEAVQGLSDLFSIRLQNDDVQDFDTRWDQALLTISEILTEMVLEEVYKSKSDFFTRPVKGPPIW